MNIENIKDEPNNNNNSGCDYNTFGLYSNSDIIMFFEKHNKLMEEVNKLYDEGLEEFETFLIELKKICDEKDIFLTEQIKAGSSLSLEEFSEKFNIVEQYFERNSPEIIILMNNFINKYKFKLMGLLREIRNNGLNIAGPIKFSSYGDFTGTVSDFYFYRKHYQMLRDLWHKEIDSIRDEIMNFDKDKKERFSPEFILNETKAYEEIKKLIRKEIVDVFNLMREKNSTDLLEFVLTEGEDGVPIMELKK